MDNNRLDGPWEPHVGLDYACIMLPGDTTDTAAISVHTDDPDERDAVLMRIVAAPEVLAALKCLYKFFPYFPAGSEERAALHQAGAAITKAEGDPSPAVAVTIPAQDGIYVRGTYKTKAGYMGHFGEYVPAASIDEAICFAERICKRRGGSDISLRVAP